MRGRIRTIKPEAFKDADLWDIGVEFAVPSLQAFAGLWCYADREGRFEWKPRELKADILPYWDGDFSRVLDAFVTRGLVVRYARGGRDYGWIRSFTRHQVINNREEPSRIPMPEQIEPLQGIDACTTRAPRDGHAGKAEGKGREGKGESPDARAIPAGTPDPEPGTTPAEMQTLAPKSSELAGGVDAVGQVVRELEAVGEVSPGALEVTEVTLQGIRRHLARDGLAKCLKACWGQCDPGRRARGWTGASKVFDRPAWFDEMAALVLEAEGAGAAWLRDAREHRGLASPRQEPKRSPRAVCGVCRERYVCSCGKGQALGDDAAKAVGAFLGRDVDPGSGGNA